MKRFAFIVLLFFLIQNNVFATSFVYSEKDKFGLKNEMSDVVTEAKYKKLIRLGETAWIMQDGSHFGIIHDSGKIIEPAQYTQAERVLGKFAKFKRGEKYGIFDEMGFEILPLAYSSIDLLPGGMFVTCKNYKYGVTDLNGQVILDNIFDDIYAEKHNTLTIIYEGNTYQIEREGNLPFDMMSIHRDMDFNIKEENTNPIITTGYYGIAATDYMLKLISSISPAYEKTIDELMYSQGADTVNVIMKFSWLPKFPFVYAKKYYATLRDPNNGPLSSIKNSLKNKN